LDIEENRKINVQLDKNKIFCGIILISRIIVVSMLDTTVLEILWREKSPTS